MTTLSRVFRWFGHDLTNLGATFVVFMVGPMVIDILWSLVLVLIFLVKTYIIFPDVQWEIEFDSVPYVDTVIFTFIWLWLSDRYPRKSNDDSSSKEKIEQQPESG